MSTITFQCSSCDGDFDIKIAHLVERPNALKCPHCGAKPSPHRAHAFAQALDDVLSAMAALRARVHFELNLDNDELPPPYGADATSKDDGLGTLGRGSDDDDDFEEEDEFEDFDGDDDDEDEFDEDDDFEDGDEDEDEDESRAY